ncbi:enolase C-terminal domain-like protein [Phreatobacter sp.]|uniref:enolase C-terminal domain-like protein n=1 Tax=Phreatobacter sp. TaxID=1966341 RepID=UPI003F6EAAD7
MTIDRLQIRLVRWPLKMTRKHGVGDIADTLPGVIVSLQTREGLTGWGEAAPWSVFSGTAEAAVSALDVYLRPLVIGRAPAEAARIMAEADRVLVGHPEAKMALDMALQDLRGQLAGVPVADLLGGVFRRNIPLSVSIADPDFDADLDFARSRLAEGVRLFKVKTGFSTHAEDLRRLERLTAILPADASLRVDYNQGLETVDAIRTLRDVEAFRPAFIEQPVARDRRDAMAEITRALDTPILADESVFSPEEAVECARARFADAISIKLMKAGSFAKARAIAAIAGAAGMPCYGGTMYEAGIALTAGIHFAASTPAMTLGAEYYTSAFVLGTEILAQPVRLEAGASWLPEGTGLGIAVNEAALAGVTVESRG